MRHRLSSGLFFWVVPRKGTPGPSGSPGGSSRWKRGLDFPDVGRLEALRAAGHFELNPVTDVHRFPSGSEPGADSHTSRAQVNPFYNEPHRSRRAGPRAPEVTIPV